MAKQCAATSSQDIAAPAHASVRELAATANLGPKSAAVLLRAGIKSLAQIRELGSVRAFSLAKTADPSVSLNLLWALEGALLGQSWKSVAKDHRTSLLLALEDHERHLKLKSARKPAC